MIYLASPYSSPDPEVVAARFAAVEQCTAALIKQGLFVWSPIVHCHAMATKYEMPTDADFWKAYNFDFIRRADDLYILSIPGWDTSKGVKMEMNLADILSLPVLFVDVEGTVLL